MFGSGRTYFADSPVVITISGLEWPTDAGGSLVSPFNVVKVQVLDNDNNNVGEFRADTGGLSDISFDISSALRAMWSGYNFGSEVSAASGRSSFLRSYAPYSLRIWTEYQAADGTYTTTTPSGYGGGRCMLGGLTELERSRISNAANADASHWQGSNLRYGDASTKPLTVPERVGRHSITSWVDVGADGTTSSFFAASTEPAADGAEAHAPMVLRDSVPYVDFLFVNRRGAVETCSAQTLESLGISIKTENYGMTERPSFSPTRSLTARASGGRRSWQMSSGYLTREWARWWAQEFLMARQWWMRVDDDGEPSSAATEGLYAPVVVTPAKGDTGIYDRTKQQMPHVDFTVTLALEG